MLQLSADERRLVTMFKALSNPVRLAMVRYMVEHPQCITGDIVEATALAQSTVSQHLKVLRDSGLVCGTVEGPATCYCLDPEMLSWFRDKMVALTEQFEQGCC